MGCGIFNIPLYYTHSVPSSLFLEVFILYCYIFVHVSESEAQLSLVICFSILKLVLHSYLLNSMYIRELYFNSISYSSSCVHVWIICIYIYVYIYMYKYILIIIRIHELLGDEGPQIFKFGIFVQKWLNCPKKIFVFGSEEIRHPRFFY